MTKTTRITLSSGVALVLSGIALTTLGSQLDGFAKGFCQGAGVMLVMLGTWLLFSHLRRPRPDDNDGMWLPSRDAAVPGDRPLRDRP